MFKNYLAALAVLLFATVASAQLWNMSLIGGGSTPFSGALVSLSADQVIGDNEDTDILWQTELYDAGGWFADSDDTFFTVPADVDFVRVTVSWSWEADADGYRQVHLEKDTGGGFTVAFQGTFVARANPINGAAIQGGFQVVSHVLPVEVGDKFQITVKQTAGNDLDFRSSVGTSFAIQAIY